MRIEKYSYQKSKTLPVFMLVGVFLLVGLILRLSITLIYAPEKQEKKHFNTPQVKETAHLEKRQLKVHRPPQKDFRRNALNTEENGNVFDNLHTKYPNYQTRAEKLEQYKIPYAAHNPVIGDARAPVRFTIFTDPACGSCRSLLADFLQTIHPQKQEIALIFKFMPINKDNSDGGVFDQVAWRANAYEAYINQIHKKRQNLQDEDFLEILESVGVSLEQQQNIMRTDMAPIVTANQEDIYLSERLGLYKKGRIPVIFINNYRLGQPYLPENQVGSYIERLLNNEEIIPDTSEQ